MSEAPKLKLIALDTGPLGLVTHPRPRPLSEAAQCLERVLEWVAAGVRVLVPSVADYELRREYLLRNTEASLKRLDELPEILDYVPISDEALRRAAVLWARTRQAGRPTADPKALDADCIIASQVRLEAEALGLAEDEWIIATVDVGDLPRLAPAARWRDITLQEST